MSSNDSYATAKARDVFVRAGGDPDLAGQLAGWAQQAREIGDSRRGVIVSESGEILAQTKHVPATVKTCGATYVTSTDLGPEVLGREVGLALGSIRRLTGRGAIHVKFWEVCQGAGQFAGRAR